MNGGVDHDTKSTMISEKLSYKLGCMSSDSLRSLKMSLIFETGSRRAQAAVNELCGTE